MKAFNASQLNHDRRQIFEAARDDGAIIQVKNTNGMVLEEFVILAAADYMGYMGELNHDVTADMSAVTIESYRIDRHSN